MKCPCCNSETNDPVYDPMNKILIYEKREYQMHAKMYGLFNILYNNIDININYNDIKQQLNYTEKALKETIIKIKVVLKDSPFLVTSMSTFIPSVKMEIKNISV